MGDNEHLLRVDELRASMNIHDANDEEIYAVRRNRAIPNATAISDNNVIKFHRNILCPLPLKCSCVQNNDSSINGPEIKCKVTRAQRRN